MENKKIKCLRDEIMKEETNMYITLHHDNSQLLGSDIKIPPRDKQSDCTLLSKESEDDRSLPIWQKRRYLIALFAFLGFCNVYALRVNLSIAIVAMTENKSVSLENGTITYAKEFDWNSKQQGVILSSFFYGYIFTQLAGGWLAAKYGGRRLYGMGIATTSVLTILTPFAAKQSLYLLIVLRLIEGLFEGVTYPCVLEIWSRWAPPLERSKLVTTSFAGGFAGTVVSMPASAYLANAFGWESIFYVFGTIGIIWYIGWLYVIPESPYQDKHIKAEELQYLKLTLGEHNRNRSIKHPWKSILTSPAVWAIATAHYSENWGSYTIITQLPKFMKDVLQFELEKAGIGSAIPYLVMGLVLPVAGYLADKLLEKKIYSTIQVRKLFTCIAFLSQTIFMLTATYLLSPIGTTACISIAVGLGGFAMAGFMVNYLEIAPRHASVLIGIGNTVGTLPGILSPIVGGYIVVTPTDAEWKIVFFIASGIYLSGAIIYLTFARGELQNWAVEEPQNNCENGTDYKE